MEGGNKVNSVNLIGRLTADPKIKQLDEDKIVTKFHIAVDRGYNTERREEMKEDGKQTADFPQIVVWGKQAESCGNYLKKGLLVGVTGSVQTSTFDTMEGDTVFSTVVNARKVKFLEFHQKEEVSSSGLDA